MVEAEYFTVHVVEGQVQHVVEEYYTRGWELVSMALRSASYNADKKKGSTEAQRRYLMLYRKYRQPSAHH